MVVVESFGRVGRPAPAGRGDVTGFSKRSRLRLLRLIHSVRFEHPLLITLTYQEYPTDGRVYHEHLRAFRAVLERKYGRQRAIWKLEFQKRGAPHFHLVMLDLQRVDIPYLGAAWCRIAGVVGQEGKYQCFDVKYRDAKGRELRNPAAYIAKYVSKDVRVDDYEGIQNVGRFWGRWNMKQEKGITFEVPEGDSVGIVRDVSLMVGLGSNPYPRFDPYACTLFAGNAGGSRYEQDVLAYMLKNGYNPVSFTHLEVTG